MRPDLRGALPAFLIGTFMALYAVVVALDDAGPAHGLAIILVAFCSLIFFWIGIMYLTGKIR